jgi:SWI/SNF-related matrix-associated actin-dependent regulator of chromatin subfamily A3
MGALSLLTRLRQLALHPALIPGNYLKQLELNEENGDQPQAIEITPADRVRLQGLLAQAIEDNEECPICFNILSDPRITSCTHYYCFPWFVFGKSVLLCSNFLCDSITEAMDRDPRCPMVGFFFEF